MSSAAPACPHCGYPNPARPAAPASGWSVTPPSRGVSPGRVILGVVAVGVLVLAVIGVGVYRLVERAQEQQRQKNSQELVDYIDSIQGTRPPPPPEDDSTLELSAVETQPELLNREEVAAALSRNYPPLLRDAGVTGSVTVRLRIGSDGVVDPESIEVLESTHEAFSQAASRVAERLRFRPAAVGGKPVPVWVTLPVTFELRS